MVAVTELHKLMEKLSDERKLVIYRLVLDMLSAQQNEDFDDYTSEDIQKIKEAREKIAADDCVSFLSVDEMTAYYAHG